MALRTACVVLGILVLGRVALAADEPSGKPQVSSFASQVDLGPLFRSAVQADGRLRSFESHAKTYMTYVMGSKVPDGQSYGFTYLDLIFRPEAYHEREIIYVKNKDFLLQLLQPVREAGLISQERVEALVKQQVITPALAESAPLQARLADLARDVIRTEKPVNALRSAMNISDPRFLMRELRFMAPPSGKKDEPWISVSDLASVPPDHVHEGMSENRAVPGLDPQIQKTAAEVWLSLAKAWRQEDAAVVNTQLAKLAEIVQHVSPELHPSPRRLEMESWYFRYRSMTWVWCFYLLSVVPLLLAVIYKWSGARKVGMAMFFVSLGLHSGAVALRWFISGRWPNANMFEAVTTAAWFGSVLALVLEVVARRSPLKNLFALGASTGSMVALMAAYFLPTSLDSAIGNKMAALHDVWLYIHTNVIIASYALIFMGSVTAFMYLGYRWIKAMGTADLPKFRLLLLPLSGGLFTWASYVLLMCAVDPIGHGLQRTTQFAWGGVLAFSGAMLMMELLSARARGRAGLEIEHAVRGGAGTLMGTAKGGASFLRQEGPTFGQVLDAVTMVLMELSFILLWAGLVMGAIWADHTWGRPWGWDPKEVFALNTFIIIIALIHVRLKVRDKGLWTALLALFGCIVMMFNWIVINFIIVGLHSYA